MSKKADFIEETIKNELTEREKAKRKKIQEHNLKMKLQKHFYTYFKKHQGNTETDLIDFYDLEIRENIIQKLGYDEDEEIKGDKISYLNSIYSKTLKEISQIFKDNDKFLKSQEPKPTFEEFIQVVDINKLNKELGLKAPKKKKNKQGLITFLNLILSPWNK